MGTIAISELRHELRGPARFFIASIESAFCHAPTPAIETNQWRSQDSEVGGTGGLGNGGPQAGFRGRAPGGWFGGA